jgi:hypothetical protein
VRTSKPHFALDFTFSALAGEAFAGFWGPKGDFGLKESGQFLVRTHVRKNQ